MKRERVIYHAVKKHKVYHKGGFIPVFDGTDHLEFMCLKCKNIVKTTKIEYYPKGTYRKDSATIFFWFVCENCKLSGFRKIYINLYGKDLAFFYPKQLEKWGETHGFLETHDMKLTKTPHT